MGALGAWRDRMQSSQLPTWLRPSSGGIGSVTSSASAGRRWAAVRLIQLRESSLRYFP